MIIKVKMIIRMNDGDVGERAIGKGFESEMEVVKGVSFGVGLGVGFGVGEGEACGL